MEARFQKACAGKSYSQGGLNMKDLREIARTRNIANYSSLKRSDLLAQLCKKAPTGAPKSALKQIGAPKSALKQVGAPKPMRRVRFNKMSLSKGKPKPTPAPAPAPAPVSLSDWRKRSENPFLRRVVEEQTAAQRRKKLFRKRMADPSYRRARKLELERDTTRAYDAKVSRVMETVGLGDPAVAKYYLDMAYGDTVRAVSLYLSN